MTLTMQPLRIAEVGKHPKVPTGTTILSRQSLCRALGLLWLVDGALQLQAFMFTKGFARDVIAPAAIGQPSFVAGPVHWNAMEIGMHPALFDSACAGIQLALGLAFLLRRTVRVAIVCSAVWAGGIWYFGEGLGGLAGGHMTAMLGAPGAALLYVVLAVAAWPHRAQLVPRRVSARSERPPGWILRVWAALWVSFAVLNLLPANIAPSTVDNELNANSTTVPGWLGGLDRWLAHGVHTAGAGATVLLVTIELAVGVLMLSDGRLRITALWAGIAVAALYWAVGQSFGQLLSGQATDPSTGPLLILLGLVGIGAAQSAASLKTEWSYADRI